MAPSSTWCTFHYCSDCHVAPADHRRNGQTVDSIRMKRVRIVDGQNANPVRVQIQIDCMTSLARTKRHPCPDGHTFCYRSASCTRHTDASSAWTHFLLPTPTHPRVSATALMLAWRLLDREGLCLFGKSSPSAECRRGIF